MTTLSSLTRETGVPESSDPSICWVFRGGCGHSQTFLGHAACNVRFSHPHIHQIRSGEPKTPFCPKSRFLGLHRRDCRGWRRWRPIPASLSPPSRRPAPPGQRGPACSALPSRRAPKGRGHLGVAGRSVVYTGHAGAGACRSCARGGGEGGATPFFRSRPHRTTPPFRPAPRPSAHGTPPTPFPGVVAHACHVFPPVVADSHYVANAYSNLDFTPSDYLPA